MFGPVKRNNIIAGVIIGLFIIGLFMLITIWISLSVGDDIDTSVNVLAPRKFNNIARPSHEVRKPSKLSEGQIVYIYGTCCTLYEVPIRPPYKVKQRITEISGNRKATIMMGPITTSNGMEFVKIHFNSQAYGWIPLTCIIE